MKKLLTLFLILFPAVAFAQCAANLNPNFTGGGNLWGRTASQTNQYFSAKVDSYDGNACNLALSQATIPDTLTFTNTTGTALATLAGSTVNLGGSLVVDQAFTTAPPVTVTAASYVVPLAAYTIIYNGAAASTFTLPLAATSTGRIIQIVSHVAYTVSSATANVVLLTSTTPGTAILPATAGTWAELQSDGTNWDIIAGN